MEPTCPTLAGEWESQLHTHLQELPGAQKSQEANKWCRKQSFIRKSMQEAAPGLGVFDERKNEQCGKGVCYRGQGKQPWGLGRCGEDRLHLVGEKRTREVIHQVRGSTHHPCQDPSYSL